MIIEAMKQALEVLDAGPNAYFLMNTGGIANKLRQAIAEAEKQEQCEPVAWMFQHEDTGLTDCVDVQQVEWGFENNNPRWKKIGSLYTRPQQRTWVGLTDEEIDTWNIVGHENLREFVRAIEAKLKEKNG